MKIYSIRSRFMHATIAIMVLALFSVGMSFNIIPKIYQDNAYMLHKSFGFLVLCLMFLRMYFILRDGRPKLPKTVPSWQKILARSVQYIMYFLLFAMPLSGWLMATTDGYGLSLFGLVDIPFPFLHKNKQQAEVFQSLHYYYAWVFGGCIILHMTGALKHYFYNKDAVFQSMWSFKK